MPTVVIPSLLRPLTGGRGQVPVPGRTVRQVLDALEQECPGIRNRIVEEGRIRPDLSVIVDGELIDSGLLFPVGESSEVYILPRISGGSDSVARYAASRMPREDRSPGRSRQLPCRS